MVECMICGKYFESAIDAHDHSLASGHDAFLYDNCGTKLGGGNVEKTTE